MRPDRSIPYQRYERNTTQNPEHVLVAQLLVQHADAEYDGHDGKDPNGSPHIVGVSDQESQQEKPAQGVQKKAELIGGSPHFAIEKHKGRRSQERPRDEHVVDGIPSLAEQALPSNQLAPQHSDTTGEDENSINKQVYAPGHQLLAPRHQKRRHEERNDRVLARQQQNQYDREHHGHQYGRVQRRFGQTAAEFEILSLHGLVFRSVGFPPLCVVACDHFRQSLASCSGIARRIILF